MQFIDDVHEYNRSLEKSRLGKILTIIDGAIADETQRKAIKDLVNDAWYGASNHLGMQWPQPNDVADALGFTLYELHAEPTEPQPRHNPYKKLIKN